MSAVTDAARVRWDDDGATESSLGGGAAGSAAVDRARRYVNLIPRRIEYDLAFGGVPLRSADVDGASVSSDVLPLRYGYTA